MHVSHLFCTCRLKESPMFSAAIVMWEATIIDCKKCFCEVFSWIARRGHACILQLFCIIEISVLCCGTLVIKMKFNNSKQNAELIFMRCGIFNKTVHTKQMSVSPQKARFKPSLCVFNVKVYKKKTVEGTSDSARCWHLRH